jgi:hypothetical protein
LPVLRENARRFGRRNERACAFDALEIMLSRKRQRFSTRTVLAPQAQNLAHCERNGAHRRMRPK